MNLYRDIKPLVSILIPTFQGEKFLEETLATAISQTYSNIEIILSDDRSIDRTREIAKEFQNKSPFEFKIFTHARLGMVNNWNYCLSRAQGKYIKFLFQDDLLVSDCIETMVDLAERDDAIGLVFSPRNILITQEAEGRENCQTVWQEGEDVHKFWSNLQSIQTGKELLEDPKFLESPINKVGEPSTVLIRKAVFEKLGLFDPELSQLVDLDMWIRIMIHYKIGFIDRVLSYFRIHPDQQTIKNNDRGDSHDDHQRFPCKMLTDKNYNLLPQTLKQDIYTKLENDRKDLRAQRERAIVRIQELEEHEAELVTYSANLRDRLEIAETQLQQAMATIEGMESSKFWKMREAWMEIKHFLLMIYKNINIKEPALLFFKTKRASKLFFSSLVEEGWQITLKRVQRKIIKKLTGKIISPVEENIRQDARLEKPKPIKLGTSNTPIVSIVIPVYNNFLYTFNCLNSLCERVNPSLTFEVIVVDDASSDETQENIKMIAGIRVFSNISNQGFIRSCNRGASEAKGKYLYFLNNDTQILPNCLESLLSVIEKDESVGAVGSQLIYPNGKLQEAGGIVWKNASGWNYGRLDSPEEPEYNYVRPVDYCSAASLLVRIELFQKLGGFSETFLPAYYEDTDLCFAIRQLGYQVLYQPNSKVIHYEGITSGTDINNGIKQYQEVNSTTFFKKWQDELEKHLQNDAKNVPQAARRLQNQLTMLVIDSYVPLYDRESGCVRMLNILKLLDELGYSIIFLPDNGNPEEPYTSTLQEMGIEVLYVTPAQPSLQEQLIKRLPLVDSVWLCRPELCEKYLELIRHYSSAPIIYDTLDLHFLRLKRQQDYLNLSYQNTTWSWETYQKLETKFAKQSDATIVVTKTEKDTLEALGVDNVSVIPNIHRPHASSFPSFEQRSGLMFIGSYNHPPNIDAVIWLCQEIMPIVWQSHRDITVTLLGSNMKEEVKALETGRVIVTGYVEDVEPFFLNSRVFVAPLRFGAGMKGKIGHSMSYGLPTVTTFIGAEGMGLTDAYDVIIADKAEEFAEQVIELYSEPHLWNLIAKNSLTTIGRYSPERVKEDLRKLLQTLTNPNT